MKWEDLLSIVMDAPVFESGLLLSGCQSSRNLQQQLSRWVKQGRLIQLRRGVYVLAEPYRKVDPHPFLIANYLRPSSYVSLQSVLAYFGMIPESVPATTSVTAGQTREWDTPMGKYIFRHVKDEMFFGYEKIELGGGQTAFVAAREKALLDLLYLTPHSDDKSYLKELRLDPGERFKWDQISDYADGIGSPKLQNAVRNLKALYATEDWVRV